MELRCRSSASAHVRLTNTRPIPDKISLANLPSFVPTFLRRLSLSGASAIDVAAVFFGGGGELDFGFATGRSGFGEGGADIGAGGVFA